MYEPLIRHIRKYIPLSEAEALLLTESLRHKSLKKKEHLLTQGQVCRSHYFILNGCFRQYLITDDGREQTIQFGIENW